MSDGDSCLGNLFIALLAIMAGVYMGSCYQKEEACSVRYAYTAKSELDTLRVARDFDCTIPITLKPK